MDLLLQTPKNQNQKYSKESWIYLDVLPSWKHRKFSLDDIAKLRKRGNVEKLDVENAKNCIFWTTITYHHQEFDAKPIPSMIFFVPVSVISLLLYPFYVVLVEAIENNWNTKVQDCAKSSTPSKNQPDGCQNFGNFQKIPKQSTVERV